MTAPRCRGRQEAAEPGKLRRCRPWSSSVALAAALGLGVPAAASRPGVQGSTKYVQDDLASPWLDLSLGQGASADRIAAEAESLLQAARAHSATRRPGGGGGGTHPSEYFLMGLTASDDARPRDKDLADKVSDAVLSGGLGSTSSRAPGRSPGEELFRDGNSSSRSSTGAPDGQQGGEDGEGGTEETTTEVAAVGGSMPEQDGISEDEGTTTGEPTETLEDPQQGRAEEEDGGESTTEPPALGGAQDGHQGEEDTGTVDESTTTELGGQLSDEDHFGDGDQSSTTGRLMDEERVGEDGDKSSTTGPLLPEEERVRDDGGKESTTGARDDLQGQDLGGADGSTTKWVVLGGRLPEEDHIGDNGGESTTTTGAPFEMVDLPQQGSGATTEDQPQVDEDRLRDDDISSTTGGGTHEGPLVDEDEERRRGDAEISTTGQQEFDAVDQEDTRSSSSDAEGEASEGERLPVGPLSGDGNAEDYNRTLALAREVQDLVRRIADGARGSETLALQAEGHAVRYRNTLRNLSAGLRDFTQGISSFRLATVARHKEHADQIRDAMDWRKG